ncbi:metallophosphoesterase [Labrys neptuniae]|uniref:Metallophosphoesterase n=1 Tax=Labrys neptuniae TaxID=376174 RepID=A0ABV3PXV8_9HYPH
MVPEGERVLGFDPATRLESVIDTINAEHAEAELCILSGDLTDRGDEASYRRLRTLLERLSVPSHLMLGNHDRRAAFRQVFPDAHDDGHGFVQAALPLGSHRLILLDTLDEMRPSAGFLCPRRLAWLNGEFERSPTIPTLLFLHHPPFPLGIEYFHAMLLEGGDALESLLDRHPQVLHTAFGHVHLSVSGRSGSRSFSATGGTCHPIRPVLAGMTASYVERPPCFDVILADANRIIVHSIEPLMPNALIAREFADDIGGPGEFEIIRTPQI